MEILLSGVVDLDRNDPTHIYLQLHRALREAILRGALKPGDRIPPTRKAASDLAVSRRTVLAALDQLTSEGFLESRQGAGIWIADWQRHFEIGRVSSSPRKQVAALRPAERWDTLLSEGRPDETSTVPRALRPGLPDLRLFPRDIWSRLLRRANEQLSADERGYMHISGHPELKRVLSRHLAERRLVDVDADRIVIVSSAQGALDLCARLILEPGDRVWMEEPGYRGARAAFLFAGAKIVPVPVDGEGMDFHRFVDRPPPKIIYVTPSHQYPMGSALSLERRHGLLEYAASVGAAIIEDDYDSEFQFSGRPIAAMQGLMPDAPVIYIGTLSKTVAPSLRLGYVAAPETLANALAHLQHNTGQATATDIQLAAAFYLADGHYSTHLRRSQRIYARRRDTLITSLEKQVGEVLLPRRPVGGVQLAAELRTNVSDVEVAERLQDAGVESRALSDLCCGLPCRNGLLFGFAAWSETEIRQAIRQIAKVLHMS